DGIRDRNVTGVQTCALPILISFFRSTIIDGWLHTGDMGTMDEKRRIKIVDRKKDIIISGGENISSIEIENVLYDHPAVQEVAVRSEERRVGKECRPRGATDG